MIPAMINSEETCILDYVRADLSNYVARMAGVLPSESFKGPGWLMIMNFKDKRKIRDFDPGVLAELKKAKVEPLQTGAASLPNEAVPEPNPLNIKETVTPKDQASTPSIAATSLKEEDPNPPDSAAFSAPTTVQASPASQTVEFQDISSPNKRKFTKIQDNFAIESPKSMEGAAMQRQTSNKSAKGAAKKQAGPKKLTKAQLKAQAKANAASNFNSPDSATPGQLAGLDSTPAPTNQFSHVESMDRTRGESGQSTPLFTASELSSQQPTMPVLQSPQNIQSPAPTNLIPNPEAAWASPSQNGQMANYNHPNFINPAGIFQSPSTRPGAMNHSSLAVPSPSHMPNSPSKDHSPARSGLNPNRNQQTPISTPNIEASKMMAHNQSMPNTPLFNAESRIWAGEITFRLTNVNINEDAIGAVTVQPMNQPGITIDDFMLDKWPQRLQISSFLPCNVTALMEHARNTKAPSFILHPAPDGDSPKNVKVYSAVLTKLPEKQGVLVVDFNIGESNSHGIYLFKAHMHVLGIAFLKTSFPNHEQFVVQPEAMNHNPGMMRPQLTPQQIAALKQQQSLSGAMMNQGMPMNMNGQMNPMAMNMFNMNMMNPSMFMANPGLMNPNIPGMYNLEALRRAQASTPQFMSSAPAMQQLQQMQAQGLQLHPQQIQQLQQMQRQQMQRPQNHPQ
ncbi:hypothetical protein DSO57_1023634 [Entomophthora muscae]|uniref:Uncharacterized protein n=1 Tax=Entomophthora muscae TaxID=34485 RepID=A0ACC2RHL4_9FUNG|nr:hypothetical protein DSO57_1023634 [Entomophthora muscae]